MPRLSFSRAPTITSKYQIWARPKRGIYPQNLPRHGHFNREFWGYPQVPTSSTAASVTASPSLAGQRSSNETGTPGRAFQQTKHGEDISAEHRKPGLWPTSVEQSGAAQKSPEAPRDWRFQETKTGGSSGCPRKCLVTRVTQSLNCGFFTLITGVFFPTQCTSKQLRVQVRKNKTQKNPMEKPQSIFKRPTKAFVPSFFFRWGQHQQASDTLEVCLQGC